MRSIDEIKNEIRSNFISNEVLQDLYGIDPSRSFEDQFSVVSLEAIITYIVAVSIWTFEYVMSRHKKEIESSIASKSMFSIPWYHQMALSFQLGDYLVLDEDTLMWKYPKINDSRRIIKYAAVRTTTLEGISKLQFFVSKDGKKPLSSSEIKAFETYIGEVGAAGTHFEVISRDPTPLSFDIMIVRDPMILDYDGRSLVNGIHVVKSAIINYLDGIKYGGTYNRTKMIDALQEVEGIRDVVLSVVRANGQVIYGQNFESVSGHFNFDDARTTISYKI